MGCVQLTRSLDTGRVELSFLLRFATPSLSADFGGLHQVSRIGDLDSLKQVVMPPDECGLTLGWDLGRYEFVYGSPLPEAKALQPSLEAEINGLLTNDGYPQSLTGMTFEQLSRQVLIYYETTAIHKHAAILIGVAAMRASLIGTSKDQAHNDQLKELAFSTLQGIDPTILRHKDQFFDLLLQRKPHSIVELLEVIDSFTD
jgi:hypothetical protein